MNITKKHLLAYIFAATMAAALSTASIAGPPDTQPQHGSHESKNKLKAHRERMKKPKQPVTVAGKVTDVSAATIKTSISRALLERRGFAPFDSVKVKVMGKTFNAQLIAEEEYLQLKDDPSWRETTSFDVVCLIPGDDAAQGVTIEGLSGPLGDWLGVRRNMRVSISKTN